MTSLLITGGTGSLGRALVPEAVKRYDRVVIFSSDEFKQAMMHKTVGHIGTDSGKLRFFLGNVRDPERLLDALVGVDHVIHAAALKWVGDGVYNPGELVATNVLGTMNVIRAATERGVSRVLVVTSDKGVHPINAYGGTKFLAERYAVAQNAVAFPRGTRVACVRLGNLLWSRGSVAHRFREAIRSGGFPEVTSPEMTRFGIRLPDAATFCLTALRDIRGGEIFVPSLPAYRIPALVEAAWEAWHEGDIKPFHEISGLRPGGERLYEVLVGPEEVDRAVGWDKGWVVEPAFRSWDRPPWTAASEGWIRRAVDDGFRSDAAICMPVEDILESFMDLDEGLPSV